MAKRGSPDATGAGLLSPWSPPLQKEEKEGGWRVNILHPRVNIKHEGAPPCAETECNAKLHIVSCYTLGNRATLPIRSASGSDGEEGEPRRHRRRVTQPNMTAPRDHMLPAPSYRPREMRPPWKANQIPTLRLRPSWKEEERADFPAPGSSPS